MLNFPRAAPPSPSHSHSVAALGNDPPPLDAGGRAGGKGEGESTQRRPLHRRASIEIDRDLSWKRVGPLALARLYGESCVRNGIMPHLWGINLSHIYAREVRWYFEFNSWYSSKICSCLSKKTWHNLHLFFFEMSTLKGDERVNIFHFTIHFFRPYVKIGESRLKFVCRNVIF